MSQDKTSIDVTEIDSRESIGILDLHFSVLCEDDDKYDDGEPFDGRHGEVYVAGKIGYEDEDSWEVQVVPGSDAEYSVQVLKTFASPSGEIRNVIDEWAVQDTDEINFILSAIATCDYRDGYGNIRRQV